MVSMSWTMASASLSVGIDHEGRPALREAVNDKGEISPLGALNREGFPAARGGGEEASAQGTRLFEMGVDLFSEQVCH